MAPRPVTPRRGRLAPVGLLAALLVLGLALAGGCAAVKPTFDPGQPCAGADTQRQAGFYPDLEALLPRRLFGSDLAPESGRYCSAKTLGPLYDRGFREVHFAGATWNGNGPEGIGLAVYQAPGLDTAGLAVSFEAGARAARGTQLVRSGTGRIGEREVVRVDVYANPRNQSIILWADETRLGVVRVVIASDTTADRIAAAVAALGGG